MVTCPNCQGEGTEVIDRGWMPNYGFYYPKRFLTVNCNKCSGEGFVFIDIPEDELEDYI
jgi:ribosomal protein S27E